MRDNVIITGQAPTQPATAAPVECRRRCFSRPASSPPLFSGVRNCDTSSAQLAAKEANAARIRASLAWTSSAWCALFSPFSAAPGRLDVTATSVCDANAAHRLASWFFTNRGKLRINSMEWANLPFWFCGYKHSFGTSARWEPTASAAVPSGFPRRVYWVPEVGGVPTVPPTEPAVCAVQPAAVRAKAAASTATTTFTA